LFLNPEFFLTLPFENKQKVNTVDKELEKIFFDKPQEIKKGKKKIKILNLYEHWEIKEYEDEECSISKNHQDYDFILTNNLEKINQSFEQEKIIIFNLEAPFHMREQNNLKCESLCTGRMIFNFGLNGISMNYNTLEEEIKPLNLNKKKKILVMISNCQPDRLEIIKTLKDLFPLETCGKCFNETTICPGRGKRYLHKEVISFIGEYKFFLAFENCQCKDYITEKFYRTILSNTIPIIYKKEILPDYLKIIPHKTYEDLLLGKINFERETDYSFYNSFFQKIRKQNNIHKLICKNIQKE